MKINIKFVLLAIIFLIIGFLFGNFYKTNSIFSPDSKIQKIIESDLESYFDRRFNEYEIYISEVQKNDLGEEWKVNVVFELSWSPEIGRINVKNLERCETYYHINKADFNMNYKHIPSCN